MSCWDPACIVNACSKILLTSCLQFCTALRVFMYCTRRSFHQMLQKPVPGVEGRPGLMDLSCASCVSGTALNRCVTFNIFFSLWLLSNSQWKNFTWRLFHGAFSPLEYVLAQRWVSFHAAVTAPPCCYLVVLVLNHSLIFFFLLERRASTHNNILLHKIKLWNSLSLPEFC